MYVRRRAVDSPEECQQLLNQKEIIYTGLTRGYIFNRLNGCLVHGQTFSNALTGCLVHDETFVTAFLIA